MSPFPCANGLTGNALPWVSSPSLTTKVPACRVVDGALALLSRSRGGSPSSLTDVGGESMPLWERTKGFDAHRSFCGECDSDPLRLGGSVLAALPWPSERSEPRFVLREEWDGGGSVSDGEPGGDGDVSTHSSSSSSVCQAGVELMANTGLGCSESMMLLCQMKVSRECKQPGGSISLHPPGAGSSALHPEAGSEWRSTEFQNVDAWVINNNTMPRIRKSGWSKRHH